MSHLFPGVAEQDGVVYCIGGTYGPSGTKYCFKLTDNEDKWDRIANMLTGEIQIEMIHVSPLVSQTEIFSAIFLLRECLH